MMICRVGAETIKNNVNLAHLLTDSTAHLLADWRMDSLTDHTQIHPSPYPSIEAMCKIANEDVVRAAPTGDAPTTFEWSTISFTTKVLLY